MVALDALTLLVAARGVGLTVTAPNRLLQVRGPRGAVGLVRLLFDREPEVLALLDAESTERCIAPAAEVVGECNVCPPSPSDRHEYQAQLARWPIPWRERWGKLANELEDRGLASSKSGHAAFRQIRTEMAQYEQDHGPIEMAVLRPRHLRQLVEVTRSSGASNRNMKPETERKSRCDSPCATNILGPVGIEAIAPAARGSTDRNGDPRGQDRLGDPQARRAGPTSRSVLTIGGPTGAPRPELAAREELAVDPYAIEELAQPSWSLTVG